MVEQANPLKFLPAGFRPVEKPDGVRPDDILPEADGKPRGKARGGDGVDDARTIDIAAITTRRGKGRPKGTGKEWSAERRAAYAARRASGEKEDVALEEPDKEKEPPPYAAKIIEQFAFYIQFAHGSGEWKLTDEQSLGLAKALCGVLKYHVKIDLTGGGIVGAYLALIGTLLIVYGPKLRERSKRQQAEREATAQAVANSGPMIIE